MGPFLRNRPDSSLGNSPVIFNSVVDNLIIVKDSEGNAFWPLFDLNTIGDLESGKGYQIKMLNSTILQYPSLD